MARFVGGEDRLQPTPLPSCLDDYIAEDNAARVVDVFVAELDLRSLGFEGVAPSSTGRPAYHPGTLLKLRLSKQGAIEPPPGARGATQRRADVAYRTTSPGPQDHRQLPTGRRRCNPSGL